MFIYLWQIGRLLLSIKMIIFSPVSKEYIYKVKLIEKKRIWYFEIQIATNFWTAGLPVKIINLREIATSLFIAKFIFIFEGLNNFDCTLNILFFKMSWLVTKCNQLCFCSYIYHKSQNHAYTLYIFVHFYHDKKFKLF